MPSRRLKTRGGMSRLQKGADGMHPIFVARIGTMEGSEAHRILVDRLWPRGVRKANPPWDSWLKDLAPSTELRRWYGHDPVRYAVFREQYWRELSALKDSSAWHTLQALWRAGPIALVTASRDLEHSQAPVLRDFLEAAAGEEKPSP